MPGLCDATFPYSSQQGRAVVRCMDQIGLSVRLFPTVGPRVFLDYNSQTRSPPAVLARVCSPRTAGESRCLLQYDQKAHLAHHKTEPFLDLASSRRLPPQGTSCSGQLGLFSQSPGAPFLLVVDKGTFTSSRSLPADEREKNVAGFDPRARST